MLSPSRFSSQAAGAYWARRRNRISTALVDDLQAPAWGTIVFTVNPSAAQTITINGTAITFVSGTPAGAQVKIGATLAATLAAIEAYVSANAINGVGTVSVSGDGLTVLSASPADVSVTLAASNAVVPNGTLHKQQINARVAL